MKFFLQVFVSIMFFSNVSCAEEPTSPISGKVAKNESPKEQESEQAHEKLTLDSLVYEGKKPFGGQCSVAVAVVEDEDHGHHHLVAKVGYRVHGQALADSEVMFKDYNLDKNSFYDLEKGPKGSVPVLISASTKDGKAVEDINALEALEQSGQLQQFVRFDFFAGTEAHDFIEALEAVTIAGKSTIEDEKTLLNVLEQTVFKINHGGHYDTVACFKFKPLNVQKLDYDLDADHEEDHGEDHDDHDHDHGHEH